MPNAIDLLTDEHRRVEHLFARYEDGGDPAVVHRISAELTVQTRIEETIVYPVVRDRLPEGPVLCANAGRAHDAVKSLVAEAEETTPAALPELVSELRQTVRRHVAAEEALVLPRLQEVIGTEGLDELGDAISRSWQDASPAAGELA